MDCLAPLDDPALLSVLAYFASSLVMIPLNREAAAAHPYTFILACFQCALTVLLLALTHRAGRRFAGRRARVQLRGGRRLDALLRGADTRVYGARGGAVALEARAAAVHAAIIRSLLL